MAKIYTINVKIEFDEYNEFTVKINNIIEKLENFNLFNNAKNIGINISEYDVLKQQAEKLLSEL